MKQYLILLGIFLLIVQFSFIGCQKKATKIPESTLPSMEQVKTEHTQKEPETEEPTGKKLSESDISEKEIKKEPLVFQEIYFDFDKYNIRPDMREILAHHARLLKENPTIKLRIEGHCDERGTIEYNLALGERRANSVKNYLVNYGIDPNRLTTISYGEERPKDPRHNEEAWAKNRRVEFVIITR